MFIRILLSIAVIFSFGVCFFQPKMHTKVLVYNYEYSIAEPQKTEEQVVQTPVQTDVKTEVKKEIPVKTETKKSTQQTQQIQQTEPVQTKTITKQVQNTPAIKKEEQKVITKQEQKPITKQEQEEIIAWNKWHSEIQNSIMRDTKMPMLPDGTRFEFSFTVDKYGKISDIRTWSTNPIYTPYAVEFIAPVIRNLQGKSILDFPVNSQRVTTQFVGKFRIALNSQNKYSTASDFNDMEKIRK